MVCASIEPIEYEDPCPVTGYSTKKKGDIKLIKIYKKSDIEKLAHEVGCLICGSRNLEIRMYPHDGGVEVEGEIGKQWVYAHCNSCQYDSALWKMEKRRNIE